MHRRRDSLGVAGGPGERVAEPQAVRPPDGVGHASDSAPTLWPSGWPSTGPRPSSASAGRSPCAAAATEDVIVAPGGRANVVAGERAAPARNRALCTCSYTLARATTVLLVFRPLPAPRALRPPSRRLSCGVCLRAPLCLLRHSSLVHFQPERTSWAVARAATCASHFGGRVRASLVGVKCAPGSDSRDPYMCREAEGGGGGEAGASGPLLRRFWPRDGA